MYSQILVVVIGHTSIHTISLSGWLMVVTFMTLHTITLSQPGCEDSYVEFHLDVKVRIKLAEFS